MMRNYKAHVVPVAHMLIFLFFSKSLIVSAASPLEIGFYQSTCPLAEAIVRRTVTKVIARDHGLAAGLIRMHFHDCFVRGCDGSVLLDSTHGSRSEKESIANNPSLRGFELIDDAKAKIEAHCPKTVSCADILAFAARDSVLVSGGIDYPVPSGRRDGKFSIESEVIQNLPLPTFNSNQLREIFQSKGLSAEEMVTLSGAHSIGVSHCSSFKTRLFNFNSSHPQDPSLDRHFAAFLKSRCPSPSKTTSTRSDPMVPLNIKAPNHLDEEYYKNLMMGKGLFTSDQTLISSPRTAGFVIGHARNPSKWKKKFAAAMVRMGYMHVLTGKEGEIRKNCRVVNT